MKTYNQVAADVLQRRDHYEAAKRRRQKRLVKTVLPVGGVCLAVLLAVGLWPRQSAPAPAPAPGITTPTTGTTPVIVETLVINPIEGAPFGKMGICLLEEDLVAMTPAEVNAYCKANIFPTVPADMAPREQALGLYRRDGGTGELYWDQFELHYQNPAVSRTLHVKAKPGALPLLDYRFGNNGEPVSVIGGQEMMIGRSEDGGYHAFFLTDTVGFCVSGTGLTQEEFVAVLASLLGE